MKSFIGLAALSSITLFKSVCARSVLARADPATTDPNDDPFYAQPANINSFNPGDVISQRAVDTVFGINFTFTNYSSSHQLKYRTTDGQGKAVSTVATLWTPVFPRNPPSIFSYQYAEDAINLDCAPSWVWVKGSGSDNKNVSYLEGPAVLPWALTQGYYVVQPDAEGPNSTWIVGNMEGKATLDGIRAAINYSNLNKTRTQVALYGYSGGAFSTVWASELHENYANELNIVGAAFGGTPVDLISTFKSLNGGSEALLAGTAVFGLAAGYPTLEADFQTGADGLTAEGKAVEKQLRARNFCANSELDHFNGTDFNKYFKKSLLQNPTFLNIANSESLLTNVSTLPVPVPKFPRYQWHGTADVTVPYPPEAAYVDQQCKNKANIQFHTFDGLNHSLAAVAGLPGALLFIGQAFAGLTPNCTCGTSNCF